MVIGQVYQISLAHYQLTAGIAQPILEDTCPIPWSSARWIDQLRAFLHHTQGSISLHDPWKPQLWWDNDHFIMEDVLNVHVPKQQALQIQHICIFLKVNTLSDIVNHRGTSVITVMLYPAPAAHHVQHYQKNMSTIQWPQTHPPSPAVWHAWQTFILWMYLQPNSFQLQQALGPWRPTYQQDYQWR